MFGTDVPEAGTDRPGRGEYHWNDDELADLERIRAIGFTDRLLTVRATAAFFALGELPPSDNAEVAEAVHIIRNKLMSRPAHRKYLRPADAHPPEN